MDAMTTTELNAAVAKELDLDPELFSFTCDRNHSHNIVLRMFSSVQTRVAYLNALRDVIAPNMPKNKVGTPMVTDYDMLMAHPWEMCVAFLKTKGIKVQYP